MRWLLTLALRIRVARAVPAAKPKPRRRVPGSLVAVHLLLLAGVVVFGAPPGGLHRAAAVFLGFTTAAPGALSSR